MAFSKFALSAKPCAFRSMFLLPQKRLLHMQSKPNAAANGLLKRSLFGVLGECRRRKGVILGSALTESLSPGVRHAIGGWLLGCAGLVFGAIVIGGVTRLTESGLSMVEWHVIKGMKPPLSREAWQEEFNKYKQYPEYQYKVASSARSEMTLGEFQFIFFMEYIHRMAGRAIGVVFALPAVYFWSRGHFSAAMKKRVLVAGALIGVQGLLGWYMVKSGLDPSQNSETVPRVSQYRLAAHLSTAIVLYTVLLWTGLSHVLTPVDYTHIPKIGMVRGMAHGTKTVLFLTAVAGAFVAGLDAGLVYNSWPKYADLWIPTDIAAKKPAWKNIFDNPTTVQFIHRNLAYVSIAMVTATWFAGRKLPLTRRTKFVLHSLLATSYMQGGLGIAALLMYVPTWLCSLHQTNNMLVFTFIFWLTSELRRVPK